jgi:hypothetical protein
MSSIRFLRRSVLALGLAAALAAPVGAQDVGLARLTREFGEDEAARIVAVIDAGVDDGLPRELLVGKAVEGAAKHMSANAVRSAVATLADELRAAVPIVGRENAEKLSKAADALRHGVDREFLVQLDRDHPRDFAMMIVALEDLLHAGVSLEEAQGMVADAASRGYAGEEVLNLPATVRRLVREGRTPLQAASSVREGVRRGRVVIPPPPPALGGPLRTRTGGSSIPPFDPIA